MWQRNAAVLSLVVLLACQASGSGQSTLVADQNWVHFDVVLGRVTATYLRGGQGQHTRAAGDETVHEQLTINGDLGRPSLHYERVDDECSLKIDFVNSTSLEIFCEPLSAVDATARPVVQFEQRDNQPLRLTVGAGKSSRIYEACSLWHLLIHEPQVCGASLLPLLAVLRQDWHLERTAAAIEAELFQIAGGGPTLTRGELKRLVDLLDDPLFHKRQEADRQLQELGVMILPFLQQLDPGSLSHEQRLRVRRLQEHLRAPAPDSATRVAAWLVHDNGIWLHLLTHREPAKREAAAAHLVGIHPGQIHFEPLAEETRRNEQIARLRLRLDDN
jgi:hypothetical protein